MAVISISYDLHKEPWRAYTVLIDAIKRFGVWAHPVESTWFVETNLSPQQVFDYLKPCLHARDKVIITPIATCDGWWSQGMSQEVLNWFRTEMNSSEVTV
jgi:hypothetical protein